MLASALSTSAANNFNSQQWLSTTVSITGKTEQRFSSMPPAVQ